MMVISLRKPNSLSLSLYFFQRFRQFCQTPITVTDRCLPSPVNPSHLLLVCTVLYQHQDAPVQKLHSRLRSIGFHLSHEFFLQVCNKFPLSWKPVHRFYLYTLQEKEDSSFPHSTVSTNKVVDVLGKGRNVPLLWEFLSKASEKGLANEKSYLLGARFFAEGRQIRKLVGVFDLIEEHKPSLYNAEMLNRIVGLLCHRGLVVEAGEVVGKMRASRRITPDAETYGFLIVGLCRKGDLVEASKHWNKMVEEEGLEPEMESYEEMMVTFFKVNRWDDGFRVFKTVRAKRIHDVGSCFYKTVIDWMCKERKIEISMMLTGEMIKRGIDIDFPTLGSLLYGLLARRKVREAYNVYFNHCISEESTDIISVYHGLIKGFLRLKRPSDATQVFREMVVRGCEPIMHTYIMLLQGHMGKKGRKGRDPLVNFDSIFVGGLVKVGRTLEATKYVERMMWGSRIKEVPIFDYNKFVHSFSNEEGVVMFEEVGKRMKDVGMIDLGDVFLRYGEKMATRDRRRRLPHEIANAVYFRRQSFVPPQIRGRMDAKHYYFNTEDFV